LSSIGLETHHQDSVNAYFAESSAYWADVYEFRDVTGAIYRERRSAVLALAQELKLPVESSILEIGCGSGSLSIQLALQGYTIQAADSVDAMVESTRQRAHQAGVGDRVSTIRSDVYHLGYPDDCFHLVLTIGLAPWLHSLDKAICEVARVLRPGGYLIATADNWWRLNHWLDPRYFPPLRRMKRRLRNVLERLALIHHAGPSGRLHSIKEFDACLSAAGLQKVEGRTLGFGPLSFLGRKLLSDSFGVKMHDWMQALADRGVPIFRSMGTQYIVLAQKGAGHRLGYRGEHNA
jgi:ubiquinone/menaquinone biosynthesis C-methylase UbiE